MKINNQEIVLIAMKKDKTREVTEGEEIWQDGHGCQLPEYLKIVKILNVPQAKE